MKYGNRTSGLGIRSNGFKSNRNKDKIYDTTENIEKGIKYDENNSEIKYRIRVKRNVNKERNKI